MGTTYTTEQVQEIINWTLPGLTMYYRDTDLPQTVIDKYGIGDIFRSQTFVDVSGYAGRLTKNCRFVFASSKAAPLYKINPATEKWQLHCINANSYFKVLDLYQKDGKTQVFCLHIPAGGIGLFKMLELIFGDNDIEKQITAKARASFDEKQQMGIAPALEETEWIERTDFPIGLNNQNDFFSLYPTAELISAAIPLYDAIRKLTNDTTEINVPIVMKNQSE